MIQHYKTNVQIVDKLNQKINIETKSTLNWRDFSQFEKSVDKFNRN